MRPVIESPIVRASGVTCSYDGTIVLDRVDLDIRRGDFIGVVGPSGSGKSTLLRAISGALRPIGGSVERQPDTSFGFVPQLEKVDWDFPVTVTECVLMARTRPLRRFWATPSERRAERAKLLDVLGRLGIADLADRHIRALSGGQQQRMFLARALMTDADVLLLDEPTSGLDVRTRHEVLHLLDELRRGGMAVVITTHDLNGIAAHLPHLVCLNTRVIGAGPPHEVLTPANLERTYGSPMHVLEHAGMPVIVDAPTNSTMSANGDVLTNDDGPAGGGASANGGGPANRTMSAHEDGQANGAGPTNRNDGRPGTTSTTTGLGGEDVTR